MQIMEVWTLICELSVALGARNITRQQGCWEHENGSWYIALNLHAHNECCTRGVSIPQGAAYMEFNGQPLILCSPGNGLLYQNLGISESILITELQKAIMNARQVEMQPIKREMKIASLAQAV